MCEIVLSAYKRGCKTPSGVKSLIILNHDARVSSDVVYSINEGLLAISGTSGMSAYRIIPIENSTSITTPITSTVANNSFKYERVIETKLDGYTAAMYVLLDNLMKGRAEVMIEWVNGTYTYAGEERGLSVTGGDGGSTGANLDDGKGITLTFTEEAIKPMPIADYTQFAAAFTVVEPS